MPSPGRAPVSGGRGGPTERRARLLELELGRVGVVVPQNFTDTPGVLVMTAAREQGLEGVVAKRVTSVYQPGGGRGRG